MNTKILYCLFTALLLGACSGNMPEKDSGADTGTDAGLEKDDIFNIEGNVLIEPQAALDGLIRNPCMGWGLYDDAQDYVGDAFTYWYQMDQYAQYATHFYVRWRWAEMEPEEGEYVWKDKNSNFSRLVQGALDRGLKLAFRVYYDSDGQHYQATPDYVRQAGAKGRTEIGWADREMWSPYVDDPVFHEKLEKFVRAFAEEFDDPDRVDFVDGFNLGYWGEGHDLSFSPGNDTPEKLAETVRWITGLYGDAFKKVPLVINYHKEIGAENLDWVLENQDYQLRHDAFGSQYYSTFEKEYESKWRTKRMIVAESCYWFVGTDKGAATSGSYDFTEQWRGDPTYNPRATSWADVYSRTYSETRAARANILDMREYREAKSWTTVSPDIVQDFIINGGYRFTPIAVSFPQEIVSGETFKVGYRWRNHGFGICPNYNRRWNNKYKAAIALADSDGSVKRVFVDKEADPGDWLAEKDMDYIFEINGCDLPAGKYSICIGVADTSKEGNPAGLNLDCGDMETVEGWTVLGTVTIR